MMLKAYMVYSLFLGPQEGAGLVFAHTVREARKIGWQIIGRDFTDQYIDFAATWLRNEPWLFDEADPDKLANGVAHAVFIPNGCNQCGRWGHSRINEFGLCGECEDAEYHASLPTMEELDREILEGAGHD
jgi:hypothetical protein